MNEASEQWAGVNRLPRVPNVVEGFSYPKPVQALIKKMNQAFNEWAEADASYSEAEDAFNDAKLQDAAAFAKSILEGLEDPGEVHTPVAERKLKGAQILVEAKRVEANKAGRAVEEAMKVHGKEITLEAVRMAREGLTEFERLLMEAARLGSEALDVRAHSLQGLKEIAPYLRGRYNYEPNFPVSGQVSMPNMREDRVKAICDHIEKQIENGSLFGSDEIAELEEISQ